MVARPVAKTLAIAHRGGAGLAPENTMAAFARSVALGFRVLETDVRATRDRRLACLHDAGLHRVSGLAIQVRDCTWRDLARMPVAGEHPIPSLPEVLDAFPGVEVSVDLKEPRAIGPLADLLSQGRYADRVWVSGAWDGWLAQLRARAPMARTALGWQSLARFVAAARWGARPPETAGSEFVHLPQRLVHDHAAASRVVDLAAALGLRPLVWTVDDRRTMDRLLDAGVAGIITGRPDVLREALLARGEWTPMDGRRRWVPGS